MKTRKKILLATFLIGVTQLAVSQGGGNQPWRTNGNAAASGDFLGTTNNEGILFKTNNQENMFLGTDGTLSLALGYSGFNLCQGIYDPPRLFMYRPTGGAMLHSDVGSGNNVFKFTRGNCEKASLSVNGTTDDLKLETTNSNMLFFTDTRERMRIKGTGNIGMGTDDPIAPLHLQSNRNLDMIITPEDPSLNSAIQFRGFGPDPTRWAVGHSASDQMFKISNAGNDDLNSLTRMAIDLQGRVGVGVNPIPGGSRLTVAGRIESTNGGYRFPDGTVQTTAAFTYWEHNGSRLYYNSSPVGIGTTTPSERFEVEGNIRANNLLAEGYVEVGANSLFLTAPGVLPPGCTTTQAYELFATDNDLHIQSNTCGGQYNTIMNDGGTGRVGIGLSNPDSKLEVRMDGASLEPAIEASNDNGAAFHIAVPSVAGNFAPGVQINDVILSTTTGGAGNLILQAKNANTHIQLLTNNGGVIVGSQTITSGAHDDFALSVDGKVVSREVVVTNNNWADYVFCDDYALKPLHEVEAYIEQHQHLPEIPSAAEVAQNGIEVSDMLQMQMQKIEELTLYVIQLKKELKELKESK